MSQAQNYLTAKQYLKSIETVELVRRNYGTTSAASEADDLIPNIYITWAKDRRDSSDFTGAESTLKTFNAWATAEKQVNNAKLAQLELAHTYLAWGQSLQTEKKLEDAKAKFDLTIATDPEPEAQAGPAIQAKAANVKLYIDWGDSLVAKNDFTGAISHYETAISLADAKDQPAIKDHIADVHLKLADNLSGKEDFIGALKEIEHASAFAATADAKTNTETMQTKTYQAFSMSSGAQARAAILEAAKKICVKEQPELPIFGLDKQNIRAYLSIDPEAVNLADDILATTPASLHYIGCVIPSTKGEKLKTHLSKTVGGGSTVVSNSYVYVERATSYWDVRLYDIKTGKMVATQQFAGIPPIDWGAIWSYIDNNNVEGDITFAGPPPTLETISAWVEKYLK
jgi:tetratricopeptide (TPR) repeat protein